MQSVEWPDTSQLFDKAEYVMKNPVDQGGFFSHTFVCRSTMQRHFVHNMYHKKLIYNWQEKKPFKTSVIHCCQTNTHFLFELAKRVGGCCTVRKETKTKSRDDRENWYPLKCASCPGSIQCERTSFLPSFAVSEVRKTYLRGLQHCTALHCTIQFYVNCGGVSQILIVEVSRLIKLFNTLG